MAVHRSPATIRTSRPGQSATAVLLAVFVLVVSGAGIAAAGSSRSPPVPLPGAGGSEASPPAPPTSAPGAGRPVPGAGYGWPLRPAPAVLTPFRPPAQPYGPGHRGVDLEGTAGQPVLAARNGTVVFAGSVAGHGVVSVDHADGLRTTYEPLRPVARAGALVRAGDVLGLLTPGHPGCPGSVCLHWGVRRDRTEYLDPLALLGPVRVRLLPTPVPWPLSSPVPE